MGGKIKWQNYCIIILNNVDLNYYILKYILFIFYNTFFFNFFKKIY